MRRIFEVTAVGLVAATVGLGAQSRDTKDATKDETKDVTLTGCLQANADRAAVGTSGSGAPARSADGGTAASANAGRGPFLLVNAKVGGAPGCGSGVTSVAPPGSGATEQSVRAGTGSPSPALIGATGKNGDFDKSASGRYLLRSELPELARHVGQEVEVSGKLTASSSPASASSAAAQPGSPTQELDVKTIRMIASACVVP